MSLQELMALCTTLSDRVLALETDLRQTKKVYGTAYTKLIIKVKKLEKTVKSNQARRRTKVVVSDDKDDLEDSSKQERMIEDIDQDTKITLVTPTKVSSQEDQPEDQLGVLSAAKVLANAAKKKVNTYTRRRRAVSTGSEGVNTGSRILSTAEESVSTTGESMPVSAADVVQKGVKEKAQKLYEEEQARFNTEQEAKFNAEQEELLASETTKDEANPSVTDERFSTTEPTDDKEKALWVEPKRLFEPDNDDILWKLQRGGLLGIKVSQVSTAEYMSFYCWLKILPLMKIRENNLIIVNGDAPAAIASVSCGVEADIPPKTTAEKIAKRNELKAKSTLLLAIPNEHLLKFHGIKDAKTLWEEIKTRFAGYKEYKKIQKTILKQQYENFVASRSEGLDKTYDMFQKLISQLEIHGEVVYEAEIKGQSSSSPNSQNVAFVSSDNTSSTNEAVNTAHSVSAASSQGLASTSTYDDDVAMLTMRVKIFIKKIGRNLNFNGKEIIGFDKTKVECYNCHRRCHFAREWRAPRSQGNRNRDNTRRVVPVETPANVLVVADGMDKTGLSYDSQLTERDLSNKSDIFKSASDSSVNESEEDNNQENDRYKACEGYHEVPPPYTGNFMPPGPDLSFAGLYGFVFKSAISEPITSVHETKTSTSKRGHFAREWRAPRSQGNRNRDNTRRVVPVETPANVLVVADGMGNDWSYQAEEGPTDFALMAFSSSGSSSSDTEGNPQYTLECQRIFNSGCSRHMIGNKSFYTDYQEIDGGFVAFGRSPKGGKISGKGKISVLFTETECFVLSPDFKLPDENQVLLKFPRQNNMYSFDLKNVVPSGGIKREFSVARTPQQNEVAERNNRTLIEAARTMLADSLLPTTFWAEAVSTASMFRTEF
nr:ribonuclease H-like domain-containing protein [Tanacetum cinerariifolium]